jgi:hypothetical protein
MSPISIPGKVTLKQSNTGVPDLDAQQYIAAVEAADGQALENGVSLAIHRFVAGCKSDGIWDAIKASCIMAGARTLAGALIPLVGTAPTNYNFVAGDYNRETGLVGDGSTKYLDSNRNNNADPQNSRHLSVYASSAQITDGTVRAYIGAGPGGSNVSQILTVSSEANMFARLNSSGTSFGNRAAAGFIGASRNNSSNMLIRVESTTSSPLSDASSAPFSGNTTVFGRNLTASSNGRLSFYSIGEALDLALLDARVTTLISDIGAAIP